jgi:regulator of CtrA degradation
MRLLPFAPASDKRDGELGMNGHENTDDEIVFAGADCVSLSDFMASGLFQRTYAEGMQLVEETSAYLDGPGREAARALPREASLAYAGESMRLTTRLMQVASWLLVRKAVHEGEMSIEEANSEKYRLATKEIARQPRFDGAEALPARLQELIERSERLYARVERLDTRLRSAGPVMTQHHPLADQLRRVEAFFRESLSAEFPRPEFGRRKRRPE